MSKSPKVSYWKNDETDQIFQVVEEKEYRENGDTVTITSQLFNMVSKPKSGWTKTTKEAWEKAGGVEKKPATPAKTPDNK